MGSCRKLFSWILKYPTQCVCAAVCIAVLLLLLFPPTLSLQLAKQSMSRFSEHGHGFVVRLNFKTLPGIYAPSDDGQVHWSSLRLFENFRELGPSHSTHHDIDQLGGGRFSHWGGKLYFSSSDKTDPRTNGRLYAVVAKASPSWWLIITAIGLVALSSLDLWLRRERLNPGWTRKMLAQESVGDVFQVAWPFILFGLAASVFISPYTNVDSAVAVAMNLPDTTLPHFPPLYPLLTRLLAYISGWFHFITHDGTRPNFFAPAYKAPAIMMILGFQHVATAIAASYLACSIATRLWIKRAVTAVLYANPISLFFTHSILTESLFFAALYLACAEVNRIVFQRTQFAWSCIRFFLWVAVAALIRHIGIFIGALLPAALLAKAFISYFDGKKPIAFSVFRQCAIVCGGLLLVVIITSAVENAIMGVLRIEVRSIIGEAFTYRLSSASFDSQYIYITPKQLNSVIERLQAHSTDPQVAHDLGLMHADRAPWVGAFNAIRQEVSANCPSCSQSQVFAETDRRMNRVALYAIESFDPDLLKDSFLRVVTYFAPSLLNTRWQKDSGLPEPYSGIEQFNAKQFSKSFVLNGSWLFWLFRLISLHFYPYTGIIIIAVLLLSWPVAGASTFIVSFALFIFSLCYAVASSVVTVWIARYEAPLALVGLISVSVLATHAFAQRRE
jgi:hypothetical protein